MVSAYGSIVRKASLTLLALAGLAFPFPALAQVQEGDFEIGFGLGIVRLDDALTDEEDVRSEVRGGFFLTDHFELELQGARLEGGLFDETLDLAMLNAVWNFRPSERTVPYVLVGAGQGRLSGDRADSFFETDEFEETGLAYQAAAGLRHFFTPRFALRVEAAVTFDETLDETSQAESATAGLMWRIGR
jgi:opacity protein-like surface antigen